MVTVRFESEYGYRIVNMPGVPISEIQQVCNALKHDFRADSYTYYVGK